MATPLCSGDQRSGLKSFCLPAGYGFLPSEPMETVARRQELIHKQNIARWCADVPPIYIKLLCYNKAPPVTCVYVCVCGPAQNGDECHPAPEGAGKCPPEGPHGNGEPHVVPVQSHGVPRAPACARWPRRFRPPAHSGRATLQQHPHVHQSVPTDQHAAQREGSQGRETAHRSQEHRESCGQPEGPD